MAIGGQSGQIATLNPFSGEMTPTALELVPDGQLPCLQRIVVMIGFGVWGSVVIIDSAAGLFSEVIAGFFQLRRMVASN